MNQTTIGVGLAGLGRHGMRYAQHLLAGDVPRARLVAVHRRQQALGREWAAPRELTFHDSLESLAADPGVDLLVAVLPPALHPGAVAAAAAARKAVLVEKPLAADPEGARRAVELARAAGIPAMVAHTLRYNSAIRGLKERIPQAGQIHLIAVDQRFEPTDRQWLEEPAHGGIVINTAIHGVDLLHFLTGNEVSEAKAFGRRLKTRVMEDVFAACLWLKPGDILATLDNSRAAGGRSGVIEIVGSEGQLVADHVHGYLAEIRGRTRRILPVEPPVPTVREVLRAFVEALIAGRPAPIPFEEGLSAVLGAARVRAAVQVG